MILNAYYWERYFQAEFSPQLDAIIDTLENRILPGFDEIEEESKKATQDMWEAFMISAGTGDEDPADIAEDAEQAGVLHHILLNGIRQGMLNLFAVALYHAFEQQSMLFHRKELLHPWEENNMALLKQQELYSRLFQCGINVMKFKSWNKLEELRQLANSVKHAQGNSAIKLHANRPELFKNPDSKNPSFGHTQDPQVFQPLTGEDLYVTLGDIKNYYHTLKDYWLELSEAMKCA